LYAPSIVKLCKTNFHLNQELTVNAIKIIFQQELDASERLDIVDGIAKAMYYLADRDYVLQKLTTKTCM